MHRLQAPPAAGPLGVTLPELVLWLLFLGVAAQLLTIPLRNQSDALVLRGVTEELIALIHQARMEARVHGAAWVVVEEHADPVLLVPSGRAEPGASPEHPELERLLSVSLAERGVELEVVGDRTSAELVYGPLGVAAFASTTLVLFRRNAERRLVISSYGRVRR